MRICPKHRIVMKASWFATRAASRDPRVMTLACSSCMRRTCPPLMGGNRTQLPITILLCVAFALPAGVLRADENHKPVRRWKVKESQDVPSNERRSLLLTPNTLDEETADGVVVYIHWERNGGEHFETFRLSRKSAFSLLAELQRATGKDVETLDFSEKVDLRPTNRILLNFNESAWVGNTLLSPGRYTVMLIQRSEKLGVLYFLPGEEMDPQQLSAKIAVKILPLASDQLKAPVVDRDADYVLHLQELRPRAMEVRLILDSPN